MSFSRIFSRSGGGTSSLWNAMAISRTRTPVRFSSSNAGLFDKILIANRGEIACRVMRTCHRLGIKTVAVYSEADISSVHASMADEAICVGPAASAQSYLNMDNIIQAVRDTGAQAVHPGYGFMSENSKFVHRLEDEGVTFIGPPSSAIEAMGDKIESKKIANQANVNVIPGFVGEVHSDEEVLKISNEIGYPVMIKASAGGGGKGMRVAFNDKEAIEGFRLSKQEAMASFNDDRMLIEKFVNKPRHIELQLLADKHGNAVYLNERDCSIQRRNQKVVEEAPSPFVDPELRKKMGEQAVALAQAVGYHSAGTVEMLVDSTDKSFYFLEMNTRLQVEHPVTEYITGLDLVEQMIRVAAGQKLAFTQSDVKLVGWAMESRVYAEDPIRGFLPSIGRLNRYEEPMAEDEDGITVRVDSGIQQGSEISMHYDPLISKLITYGQTREEAIEFMKKALDSYLIRGVKSNVNFLREIMMNKTFNSGEFTTNFIPEEYPEGFKGHVLSEDEKFELGALAATLHFEREERNRTISGQLPSCAPNFDDELQDMMDHTKDLVVMVDNKHFMVEVKREPEGQIAVTFEGTHEHDERRIELQSDWDVDTPIWRGSLDGEEAIYQLFDTYYNGMTIQKAGTLYDVKVMDAYTAHFEQFIPEKKAVDTSKALISPMPGKVISIKVSPGDKLAAGSEVAVIEAMKMQNILRCDKDVTVKAVNCKPGDEVAVDEVLVEFE